MRKTDLFFTRGMAILIMATLVFLTGCERAQKEPVRIGFIGTISGKYAALGATARDGAVFAVEQINGSGGIGGRPIELIIMDDGGSPEKAVRHAEALADQGIRFIVGPFLTSSGTSVLPIVNQRKVLTISGTTMGQNLADQDDYYLVLIPTTGFYGRELAKLALEMGHIRFVSVSDSRNDPYCSTFMEGLRTGIGKSPSTSIKEITYVTQTDVSYSEIIKPLELERIDAVFLCASPLDTAMLAQNVKRHAKEIDLFSTSWGISTELVQYGGSAVEGLYFFQSIDSSDPSVSYLRFRESFRDRFGRDPSYVAIFNYEVVQALAECLAQDLSASPEKVKELMLRKEGHQGIQSSFKLDGEGDVIRPLILHTVQAGAFIRVR